MGVITNYPTLITEIAGWLARGNLAAAAPGFVQNWEEKFLRQPRNFGKWMEAELDETIASSVIAVPSDYLGLKVAYLHGQGRPPLDRISLQNMYGRYPRGQGTQIPGFISRDRESFVFGPEPDSTYNVKGTYWAKPVVMRSFPGEAAAHWLIVNAPDLALYGSLLQATPYLQNDKRIPVWQGLYNDALRDYQDMNRDEESSGSALQEVLA